MFPSQKKIISHLSHFIFIFCILQIQMLRDRVLGEVRLHQKLIGLQGLLHPLIQASTTQQQISWWHIPTVFLFGPSLRRSVKEVGREEERRRDMGGKGRGGERGGGRCGVSKRRCEETRLLGNGRERERFESYNSVYATNHLQIRPSLHGPHKIDFFDGRGLCGMFERCRKVLVSKKKLLTTP